MFPESKIGALQKLRSRKEVVDAVNYLERIMLKDGKLTYWKITGYTSHSYPEESGQSLTAGSLLVRVETSHAEELPAQKLWGSRRLKGKTQAATKYYGGAAMGVDGSDNCPRCAADY